MNWFPALRSPTEQKKCRKLFWRIDREHLNPTGASMTVGDFGTVDPETGEFLREGNVFEHPASKEIMAELDPVRNASTVRHAHIFKHTKNVSQVDVPLGGGIGLTGIAEGNMTIQYRFGSKRGVLLFMRDVTFTRFPIEKPWADKLSNIPVFWDKVIVAETYSCRHYDLRMGKGGEHSVEITGTAEIPIPAAPALSASANVGFKIAGKAGFGSVWHGTKNIETESDGFVPMYRLKGFRPIRFFSHWEYRIPSPDFGMPGPAGELDKDGKDIFSSSEEGASEEEEVSREERPGRSRRSREEEFIRILGDMSASKPDEQVVYDIPPPGYKGFSIPESEGELDKDGKDIFSSDEEGTSEEKGSEEEEVSREERPGRSRRSSVKEFFRTLRNMPAWEPDEQMVYEYEL